MVNIMKRIIYIITIFFIISCNNKNETKIFTKNDNEELTIIDTLEYFCDSTSFGKIQLNKIEVYKIGKEEKTIAKVYLYEKLISNWKLIDSLSLDATRINDLNTQIIDYNNDKF